jgi:tripartite-type tricarboxylate transporter receptor subunit TctC
MVPVTYFTWYPMMLAAHPSTPFKTLAEMVAYAKANPDKLSLGSSGIGSTGHLVLEALNRAAGVSILHVPYRGSADALNDFLAGVVQLYPDPTVAPHVKAGKARLLAVTGKRHPAYPDVPTLGEVYPEVDFVGWNALFAPGGTPEPIIRKLALAMNEISRQPEVAATLAGAGLFPNAGTPDDLSAILRKDYDRYGKLIRELKIRQD